MMAARLRKTHSEQQWLALLEMCGDKCVRCETTEFVLLKDHIVPISRGGDDGILNLQPLCGACNSKKFLEQTDYRPKYLDLEALEHLIEVPPSYPLRACTCGYEHECPRLDPRENGKLSRKGKAAIVLGAPDPERPFGPEAYERVHPELKPPRYDDGDGDHD